MNETPRDTIKRSIKELYSKSEVNYKKSTGKDKCGNCKHFQVIRKNGCELVEGFIEPDYWCKLYDRK